MSKQTTLNKKQEYCRKVQLVINNPGTDYNHDALKRILFSLKSIVYWCMCDEIGLETQTYHTHLFIRFKSSVRFSTLKNKFPTAHIEECYASTTQNRAYIRKEGEKYADKKETNIAETFEEWGECKEEAPGKRTDYQKILNDIEAGKNTLEIIMESPSALPHIQQIDRLRSTYLEELYRTHPRPELRVIYVQGAPGVGKTRGIYEAHGYENVYRVSNYEKHPFDGYTTSQPVIVFEEFRESLPLSDMLNYLDIYPIQLPARYNHRAACYEIAYIASNWPLEQQYSHLRYSDPDTYKAFLRRIHTVRVYTGIGVYTDYTTEQYFNTSHFTPVRPGEAPF